MADHQVRDSKDAPWNAEDDDGKRYCNECCMTVEGEIDGEYQHCYEHETDVSTLREEIAQLESQNKALIGKNVDLNAKVGELEAYKERMTKLLDLATAKIRELKSCVRYKEAHIEELQEELQPSKEVH